VTLPGKVNWTGSVMGVASPQTTKGACRWADSF
jgi:hypothetical protein